MDDAILLRDYLMVLRKRKTFILLGTLACVIAAGIISFILPKTYQATMILRGGELYLPLKTTENNVRLIEDPEITVKMILSDAVLDKVRKKLNLRTDLMSFKSRFTVAPLKKDDMRKEMLPYLEVAFQGREPEQTVEVLNAVAEVIIGRHREKYDAVQDSLRNMLTNLQDKISAAKAIAAEKTKALQAAAKSIEEGERDAGNFINRMGEVSDSETTPVELLFLQSSSLAEKVNITNLKQIKDNLNTEIEKERQNIADLHGQIDSIKNLIVLSSPTEIISAPILPEKPVKPRKRLIVMAAGVLALAGTTLWAFSRENFDPGD